MKRDIITIDGWNLAAGEKNETLPRMEPCSMTDHAARFEPQQSSDSRIPRRSGNCKLPELIDVPTYGQARHAEVLGFKCQHSATRLIDLLRLAVICVKNLSRVTGLAKSSEAQHWMTALARAVERRYTGTEEVRQLSACKDLEYKSLVWFNPFRSMPTGSILTIDSGCLCKTLRQDFTAQHRMFSASHKVGCGQKSTGAINLQDIAEKSRISCISRCEDLSRYLSPAAQAAPCVHQILPNYMCTLRILLSLKMLI